LQNIHPSDQEMMIDHKDHPWNKHQSNDLRFFHLLPIGFVLLHLVSSSRNIAYGDYVLLMYIDDRNQAQRLPFHLDPLIKGAIQFQQNNFGLPRVLQKEADNKNQALKKSK
jgi:hypothetical protein